MGEDERFAFIEKNFRRQIGMYWEPQWSAVPLVAAADEAALRDLLHPEIFTQPLKDFRFTQAMLKKRGHGAGDGRGQLYAASHALAQAMLAAGKSARRDRRQPEKGIKCDMFGEFEILHYDDPKNRNPKPSEDPFWRDLRTAFVGEFKETERLCALGLVKRLATRACRKGHPLSMFFKKADTFPSTTAVALTDWFAGLDAAARDNHILAETLTALGWHEQLERSKTKKVLAQYIHDQEEEQVANPAIDDDVCRMARKIFSLHKMDDAWKYYAILIMDGDRMGDLINGVTLGARWETVVHPDLKRRIAGNFVTDYQAYWNERFGKRRLVSPAVHAAISEALGDFSLLAVPMIVKRHSGRLIYAGGDDVCAVLPVATVLPAAREIADIYRSGFLFYDQTERMPSKVKVWSPKTGRLVCHLGHGKGISISAGVMIAHHKRPLGRVLTRAHQLLDLAKDEGGRNALMVELDKRSGGGRTFMCKWDQLPIKALRDNDQDSTTILDSFLAAGRAIAGQEDGSMSSSLAYRMDRFRHGIVAILAQSPEMLPNFIAKQLARSNADQEDLNDARKDALKSLARQVAGLIATTGSHDDKDLPLEALIVAKFIGWHQQRHVITHNGQGE